VTVEPILPSRANTIDAGNYGSDADIPFGTVVTISNGIPAQNAVYTYTNTGTVAAPIYTWVRTGAPVVLDTQLLPNESKQYTVTVDLPSTAVLDEIPIPIVAFPDTGATGYTNEATTNITIDRLYTGFMRLIKEARILDTDGTTVVEDWAQTLTENVKPDQFIEYRIRYRNISTAVAGNGNTTLSARDFKIIENGTAGTNTWAANTDHQRNTVAKSGTTVNYFTNGGDPSPLTTTDPVSGTKVDKYENVVGIVAPQAEDTFQFRRQVK
jgi:uncharacterized protein YceK